MASTFYLFVYFAQVYLFKSDSFGCTMRAAPGILLVQNTWTKIHKLEV